MKAIIIILFCGIQCEFVIGDPQSGTKLSSNQGRPNNQQIFFDFGLDNHPDELGAFWDSLIGLQPEVTMDTIERILFNGYTAEVRTVITEDGYMLKLHRIPSKNKSATPVGILHGLTSIADCWLGNTKENSLPFILSDAGLDVWLFNLRGSQNSLGHVSRDSGPFSKEFWSFSIDEITNYDLPACIDYILQKTGLPQLYLVGHSLGGGAPILMLADKPEYNRKVKAVFALAPLGNLADVKRIFEFMDHYDILYEILTKGLTTYEIYLPLSKRILGSLVKIFTYFSSNGQVNAGDRRPNMAAAGYSSTSAQLVNHLDQFIRVNGSKGIVHYDWGENTNLIKYGRISPPPYNLSAVTAPCYLYYGSKDTLICEPNVRHIRDRIQNPVVFERLENWDHIDFISAENTAQMLYNPIAEIMKNDHSS